MTCKTSNWEVGDELCFPSGYVYGRVYSTRGAKVAPS